MTVQSLSSKAALPLQRAMMTNLLMSTPQHSTQSVLRSWRRYNAGRRECWLCSDRARPHEPYARLREQRLDDPWSFQWPPPRHARVHILQEVVAVSCIRTTHPLAILDMLCVMALPRCATLHEASHAVSGCLYATRACSAQATSRDVSSIGGSAA